MRKALLLALILLSTATLARAAVRKVEGGILFEYTDPGAASVNLAGDFNEWNTSATPMADPEGDGTWIVVLPLEVGSYGYKFVVNGGTWVADPTNPRTVDDGYGGNNSLVEIDADGEIVSSPGGGAAVPSGTPVVTNNALNSRVYIGGFARVLMPATSDVPGDKRLRLERPDDQYNFDFTANLSERLWASIRLQVSTGGNLDANKLAAELYKAQLNFLEDKWSVQANYNEESFQTQDPFGLMGNEDLRGTIRRQRQEFGQGTQGIVFRWEPFGTQFDLSLTDTYDQDIFTPRLPNEFTQGMKMFDRRTGTDILGLSWRLPVAGGGVRATYRGSYSDWWVNFTNAANSDTTTMPRYLRDHQDRQRQAGRSEGEISDNFELANDYHVAALDLETPRLAGVAGLVDLGYTWYDARWTLGNREEIQGTGYDDGKVDYSIGNERGLRGLLGADWEFKGLKTRLSYQYEYSEGMDSGEEYITYWTQPGTMVSDLDYFVLNAVQGRYSEVNAQTGLDILRTGPRPERSAHLLQWDLSWRLDRWVVEFELDRDRENLGFVDFHGMGQADFNREKYRVSPRLRYNLGDDDRWYIGMDTQYTSYDDPREMQEIGASSYLNYQVNGGGGRHLEAQGYLARMDQAEAVLYGLVPLFGAGEEGFGIRFDLRYVDYDGPDGVEIRSFAPDPQNPEGDWVERTAITDLDGNFFMPYVALSWRPSKVVTVELGYGVDPIDYFVISPEGWSNGRQRWRENYNFDRGYDRFHPQNLLDAEKEIEDRTQIVINAFVRF